MAAPQNANARASTDPQVMMPNDASDDSNRQVVPYDPQAAAINTAAAFYKALQCCAPEDDEVLDDAP